MSEYWKSTPKYWCKFCKAFVKDTPFEKQQHEASPRHQSSVQRNLRNIHKDNEREQRNKDRAKAELERVNGIVSGKPATRPASTSTQPVQRAPEPLPVKITAEERKQQMAQLAELGVAIPEEYRKEMAMAGQWETVAVYPVGPGTVKEEDDEDIKPELRARGVHKRRLSEDEEEEEAMGPKRGWGSSFKTYPGAESTDNDIEQLLSLKPDARVRPEDSTNGVHIKKEEDEEGPGSSGMAPNIGTGLNSAIKEETPPAETPVFFKKRKNKVAKNG